MYLYDDVAAREALDAVAMPSQLNITPTPASAMPIMNRWQPMMKHWIISPDQRFNRIIRYDQVAVREQTYSPGEFVIWVLHRWEDYGRKSADPGMTE